MEPRREWDIFISHASEDKATVAGPLSEALTWAGVTVWLDDHELKVGDILSEKIDEGLAASQFGAVVISPSFLAKHWPRRELAGLRAREEGGRKVILPIWHQIDKAHLMEFSPTLADALAVSTSEGIDTVARRLLEVIFDPSSDSPARRSPSLVRRLVEILDGEPEKERLVGFLSGCSGLRGVGVPGWVKDAVFEPLRLGGVDFDAFVLDTGVYGGFGGHGLNLILVSLTNLWRSPFQQGEGPEEVELHTDLSALLATIRSFAGSLAFDPTDQHHFAEELMRCLGRSAGDSVVSTSDIRHALHDITYYVYAGRRVHIDSNRESHDTWSLLLAAYRDESITIKSYDALIDLFLQSQSR